MALFTNQTRPSDKANQKQFKIPPEGKKIPIIIIKEEVKSATTHVNVLYCVLSMAELCLASGLTSRSRMKENLAEFLLFREDFTCKLLVKLSLILLRLSNFGFRVTDVQFCYFEFFNFFDEFPLIVIFSAIEILYLNRFSVIR